MALGNQTSSSEYVPEMVESQQLEDVSLLSGNLQTGGRQLLIPDQILLGQCLDDGICTAYLLEEVRHGTDH